jgi:hypothetical protein
VNESLVVGEALSVAVHAGLPVLLWGSPGSGKTSVVRALGDALGWPVEVVVLTEGFTPWPAAAPAGIRVVVGLLDPNGHTPPWAHPVLVDSDLT